ncbi:MAG: class I SAM-dependent methyltransferase [Crocosphaera sp.]
MLSATEKNWNSSTTLYLARRLQSISKREKIAVLDMGCGDGTVLEYLFDYGYDLYGYDFPQYQESLQKKLEQYFGQEFEKHIHFMKDERLIPFNDNSFDVIYANQVFEHVQFLESMISECSRVLKPGGILLSNFPLATHPIELHLKIPFAHWLPPGNLRTQYLYLFYVLGLRPKQKGVLPLQQAINNDEYLKNQTYYRFMNEIQGLGEYYFEKVELETNLFVKAKLDMMLVSSKVTDRLISSFVNKINQPLIDYIITNFISAAFCFKNPKK